MTTTGKQSTDLTPALTAEQWQFIKRIDPLRHHDPATSIYLGPHTNLPHGGITFRLDELPVAIAVANAALPDTDRRKVGWDYVDKMRAIAHRLLNDPDGFGATKELQQTADGAALIATADILASYLPPRAEGADSA